MVEVTKIKGWL
jgi:sperm-associated antigen 1